MLLKSTPLLELLKSTPLLYLLKFTPLLKLTEVVLLADRRDLVEELPPLLTLTQSLKSTFFKLTPLLKSTPTLRDSTVTQVDCFFIGVILSRNCNRAPPFLKMTPLLKF